MARRNPSLSEIESTITASEDVCLQNCADSETDVVQSRNVDQIEILIGQIQAYPILWDKASLEYNESHKKRLVWAEISSKLGLAGKNTRLIYIFEVV